jgi:hypothetical protein
MSFNIKALDLPVVCKDNVNDFIQRWTHSDGTERANYQLFLTELCALLDLPQPDPASSDTADNAYVFERRVDINNPDGSTNRGYIDLYRRDSFVLEAKQSGKTLDSQGWDKAMLAAHSQADNYVRALPADEGRPPFIVIVDVGRSIELYSEFTQSGGGYVPFPDPGHHRIRLSDLEHPTIQERLRRLWLTPESLDPSKYATRVTKLVSLKLAELARSLEVDGYEVERVAHFLKRCLFTMFAEDVELIPEHSYTSLLKRLKATPEHFADSMGSLWHTMNRGGFEGQLMHKLPCFNGGLFTNIDPIPLSSDQIQLLIDAAKADWRFVEPAIFGTLLERALDPRERHKLGAHYTPRTYVERLVMPTLINPLREEWDTVQVVAETWLQQDKSEKALNELRAFHHHLCEITVLDPACGSSNFLYVALEHLKRLEGEVINLISDLSDGQVGFETEGLSVNPHQFLGLEINPRAAAIAEIVLWIGYLQWHHRIHGKLNLPDPILRDFHNIENRDALIEYQSREPMTDEQGDPITIWDGFSYKTSSVTDELIPDETQRTPVYHYQNPSRAQWPQADYIIGNPPFIGASTMRRALGDGYVDAVRKAYKGVVPDSSDFVMYWWHLAAEKVRKGEAKQFGFITTNSLRQTFNRRVLEPHLNDPKKPLSLVFAIPDHPWVDSSDGAAVRIAMTVGCEGIKDGVLQQVFEEKKETEDAREVLLNYQIGKLLSNLNIGADVSAAIPLKSNSQLTSRGVMLFGAGFILDQEAVNALGSTHKAGGENIIRDYRNGRDLTQTQRDVMVIDTYGLSMNEFRDRFPVIYQWVLERVKPERDQNKDKSIRENWWLHGRPRPEWREYSKGLPRYITTVETTKHRIFSFLDSSILPDNKLVNIAQQDASAFGVLNSRLHIAWSFRTGSRLGVGNDPVYVKTTCFETFPFPVLTDVQANVTRSLAEKLDGHRKKQQAEHPGLKLTDMYNVLEKLRAETPLTDKEKVVHQQGLISILKELHDDLDRAVFDAYGWNDLGEKLVGLPGATTPLTDKPKAQAEAEEELLTRLVALNHQRASEEAQGHIRWLRPEYQAPDAIQSDIDLESQQTAEIDVNKTSTKKQTWPKELREQIKVLLDELEIGPVKAVDLADRFKRKPIKSITQVLSALEALSRANQQKDTWFLGSRISER